MALKIYDTFAPQGNYPAVRAEDVEMPDGSRLSENNFSGGGNGQDGFSPIVSVTPITGGHRVSITDVNGTKTFDVMDGKDGEDGQGGSGGSITVDSALDPNSENPVQNKVIAALVGQIEQMLAGLTPDEELSETSTNPVQNKVICALIEQVQTALGNIRQTIPTDAHINELIDTYLSEALGGDY